MVDVQNLLSKVNQLSEIIDNQRAIIRAKSEENVQLHLRIGRLQHVIKHLRTERVDILRFEEFEQFVYNNILLRLQRLEQQNK